jgi:hypothetical protein
MMPMSPRWWIFLGAPVGKATRLTPVDLQSQARRLRYIPEAQKVKISRGGITSF